MINIIEAEPTKLSGITSLYISFDYNPEIVATIKLCDKYIYNNKNYTWEVPVTSLAFLLDELTYIDDITLKLKVEEESKEHFYPKLNNIYRTKPFDYQLEGIEFGLNMNSWLLLDEPGLGKTLQMIYLAEELKEQKGLEHCLIICGINSLKTNWQEEIEKHSRLSCRILGQKISKKGKITYSSIKERATEITDPNIDAFFLITNIETIRNDDVVQALKTTKNKIGMVVADEVHRCKNPSSHQGHNLLKLSDYEHKIALTGTLIVNKPLDAFTALKWIGVEKATLTNFKNQYCVFGGFGGHQIVGYKNIDILKEEIASYSLRRLKKDVLKDLPPKTVIPQYLDMDDTHKKFYQAVIDGVKEECDKIHLDTNNVLGLTVRLKQATTCPSVLTSEKIVSSKLERAKDLIEQIVENGNKVVVMSTFKEPLRELFDMIKDYKPLLGTGDVSDSEFNKNKKLFQEDPKYKVFLGTTQKAGTGLNLNAATYMICIDTPWTYALQEQVEDRIHRANNTEPVFIYILICKDTIDEHVYKIVEEKRAMSDYVVDDVEDSNTINKLKEYIKDL